MSDEYIPSDAAALILNTPFPDRLQLLRQASEQVKAEVAMLCAMKLNAKFPEKRELTDALLGVALP